MTSVAILPTSFILICTFSISLSLFSLFSLLCQKPKWSLRELPLLLFHPRISFFYLSLFSFLLSLFFLWNPKWSLIREWPLLLFQPRLWLVVAGLPNSFQLCCRIQYIPIWYNHVLYFFVYFFYVQIYFTLRYVTQYLLGCVRLTKLSLPLLLHFEYQYYFNIEWYIWWNRNCIV